MTSPNAAPRRLLSLALLAVLASCRPQAVEPPAPSDPAFAPPAGKRAFSVAVDRSQTKFLSAGDVVEAIMLTQMPRTDGSAESRTDVLSPRAEVLRVRKDWSDDSGLVQLALTPEQAQYAALAADREDKIFLNKVAGETRLDPWDAPPKPALEAGRRGLSVLVNPDQQEFTEPGDRVDVVVARRGAKAAGKDELTALTLLQNILVLDSASAEGNEEWATLQVMLTPAQSEAMTRALASEDSLFFLARPPGDEATRPVEPARMSRRFLGGPRTGSPKS